MRHVPARLAGLATGVLGGMLLAQPTRWSERLAAGHPVPPSAVVQILGLRTMVQGAVIAAFPRRRVLAASAAVDALHAASMYLLAAADPRYRRCALYSAALATISCAATATLATRRAPDNHSHDPATPTREIP